MNIIVRLEIELAHSNVAGGHVNHCTRKHCYLILIFLRWGYSIQWHINKTNFVEEQLYYYLSNSWEGQLNWLGQSKTPFALLQRGKTPPKRSPRYDSEPSNGEVILDLWGMQITPSLPLLLDPLWPRLVVPVRVRSMGQVELFDQELFNHLTVCKQMTDVKLNCLSYTAILETILLRGKNEQSVLHSKWNHLTV